MRKALAIVFAVAVFNIIFFPFQKDFFGTLWPPHIGTIGFFLLVASFQAFLYIAKFNPHDRVKKKPFFVLAAVSLAFSFLSIFRTSLVDILFLNLVSLGSCALSLYISSLPEGETVDSLFEVVLSPISIFFESIVGFFAGIKHFRSPKVNLSKFNDHGILYILFGVAIGLPVVLLITSLLSSADPIFSKFVTNLFNIKSFPWWFLSGSISRIILSAIFGIGAIGVAYAYIKKQNKLNVDIFDNSDATRKTALIALSVVAMVALVLGTFIVVGFPYLFASVPETELHKFGVNTLSEYVTRGFSELMVVSVIVYVSSAAAVAIYKLGGKGSRLLKWFNLLLLSETVVFIFSIFRRVYVYQETHGLTRVRIYGSIFLLGLAVLTVFLMFRHSKTALRWFWYELSTLVLAGLVIFMIRPDYIIANDFKPTVNKEIDYVHIVRLSPEAVDGWIESYEDAKRKVDTATDPNSLKDYDVQRKYYYAFLTLNILRQKYKDLTLKYGSAQEIFDARATYGRARPANDFKTINIAERLAYKKLKEKIDVKELIEYEERIYKFLYSPQQVDQNGAVIQERLVPSVYDRSLESPLLEDVRIVR